MVKRCRGKRWKRAERSPVPISGFGFGPSVLSLLAVTNGEKVRRKRWKGFRLKRSREQCREKPLNPKYIAQLLDRRLSSFLFSSLYSNNKKRKRLRENGRFRLKTSCQLGPPSKSIKIKGFDFLKRPRAWPGHFFLRSSPARPGPSKHSSASASFYYYFSFADGPWPLFG